MQNQAGKDLIMTWIMKQSIAAENGASGISLSVPGVNSIFLHCTTQLQEGCYFTFAEQGDL